MEIYLAIITTVLVLTQVIRVTQNAIQLKRQEDEIKRNLAWLKDRDVKAEDFDRQKHVFELLEKWLERREQSDWYEGDEE